MVVGLEVWTDAGGLGRGRGAAAGSFFVALFSEPGKAVLGAARRGLVVLILRRLPFRCPGRGHGSHDIAPRRGQEG